MTRTRPILAAAAGFALVAVVGARVRADEPSALEKRATEVAALFRGDPKGWEELFHKDFLAKVPSFQLAAIFTSYHTQGGAARARIVSRESAVAGKVELTFEKGLRTTASLTVDGEAPNKIIGLWLGPLAPVAKSLAVVVKELEALPGGVSFRLERLDPAPRVLAEVAPEKQLGIGSTFKLYILAQLCRELEAGTRKLEDVVPLPVEARSLPSGFLHTWPGGAPLTLHTLAALMISQSDNTATDALLRTLGRAQVEDAMTATGHAEPARNVPFLSTLELFKIKGDASGKTAKAYLALDAKGRRAFLDGEVAKMPRSGVAYGSKPSHLDTLEWFASAHDLCRVMDWLRKHTARGAGARLRDVLSINKGIQVAEHAWRWVGYKGGSEPGVLNLTYLLESSGGEWFALSAGWNDPASALEDSKLVGLAQRAVELIPARY